MKNTRHNPIKNNKIIEYKIDDLSFVDNEMPFNWEKNIEDDYLEIIEDITGENDFSFLDDDHDYFYGY